jgi:hypothetical protein
MENLEYQQEWEEYRKWRNYEPLSFLLGIAGIISITLFFKLLGAESIIFAWIILSIVLGWAILFLYVIGKFHNWRCPNCGERFYEKSFFLNSPNFISNCVNCNLPKYYGSSFYKGSVSYLGKNKTQSKA